mmetsp:Transcript_27585/g.60659  ORF Transcript_27585/g.60659 Transcript_27585/m.60659 type:complete len:100 (+) Transcript_27585:436-735(+)
MMFSLALTIRCSRPRVRSAWKASWLANTCRDHGVNTFSIQPASRNGFTEHRDVHFAELLVDDASSDALWPSDAEPSCDAAVGQGLRNGAYQLSGVVPGH